jgi:hypothetical protein
MTLRADIRQAILDGLNATTRPADVPPAHGRRWVPSPESGSHRRLPSIGVWFIEEPASEARGGARERFLSLAVQCVAAGEVEDDVDILCDPMLAWAEEVLGSTSLARTLRHQINLDRTTWDAHLLDKVYVSAIQTWKVTYQTLRADSASAQ